MAHAADTAAGSAGLPAGPSPLRRRGRRRGRLAALAALPLLAVAACSSASSPSSPGSSAGSAAGAPAASAAPACAPSGGPVKLTFWNWGTGMDKAVALWNSTNPDIQVDLKTVPNGNAGTYQNLFNGLKAGTAPDLAPVEYDTLSSFRIVDGLKDISGCAGVGQAGNRFADWTWQQVRLGGDGVWGVPQDTGPLALYYRKDLFAKYGIAVPTTWDEYADAARKLKAADPSAYITHFSQTDPNWFTGLMWQNGAQLFSTSGDTWKVTVDSDKGRQVAQYWQKLIDDKLVATDLQGFSPALNKAWDTGKVVTWISAPWGWSTIRDGAPSTAGKWAVAPIPQWTKGATADGNWGGSTVAVLAGSKHPYEAAKFALWLNSDPKALAILIKDAGIYPAATAGAQDPFLTQAQPFYGGQKIFDVFRSASGQVNTGFVWGPTMTDTYRFMSDGIATALGGKGTLQDVLKDTQAKTVTSLAAQGITAGS